MFTREARQEVGRALRSWKPRLAETTLEAIVNSLAEIVVVARFVLREAPPVEVIGLRRRYERNADNSKRLRRDLDALTLVEGQIALADLMRLCGAPSPRELAQEYRDRCACPCRRNGAA